MIPQEKETALYLEYRKIFEAFKEAGVEDPFRETLQVIDLMTNGALSVNGGTLPEGVELDVEEIVALRKEGKPLEYILGITPFMGELFHCAPGALIPREETELLTRTCIGIIEKMREGKSEVTVIEMGTGSGNIAVSLALNTEGTRIFASDVSPDAVEVAAKNVQRFAVGDRVSLFCGDLFAPLEGTGLEGTTDLVVCNPPYIPTGSLEKLDAEIRDHEPVVALDAGAYGIDIFRRLIAGSLDFLRPGGVLAFEIGVGQEKLVDRLLGKSGGYTDIVHYDDGENVRVFSAAKL